MSATEQDDVQSNPVLAIALAVFALMGVTGTWFFPATPDEGAVKDPGDPVSGLTPAESAVPPTMETGGTGATAAAEALEANEGATGRVDSDVDRQARVETVEAVQETRQADLAPSEVAPTVPGQAPEYRPPAAWDTPPQPPAWPAAGWGWSPPYGQPGYWTGNRVPPQPVYPPPR